MTRPRVFIPDPIHEDGIRRLGERFVVEMLAATDAAARDRGFGEADAAIVRNRAKIESAINNAKALPPMMAILVWR